MRKKNWSRSMLASAAVLLLGAAQSASAMYVPGAIVEDHPDEFTIIGTAWTPGGGGRAWGGVATPGGATFSIMGAGLTDVSGFDPGHVGATQAVTSLGFTASELASIANWALDTWAAVSGFTNLGLVADGGGNAGASGAAGGTGDIRIGAWEIATGGVLAHAFQPGTEALFGAGGSIAGDVHFDVSWTWVDDATDTNADADIDIYTVMLHEVGHALGLGHSSVFGSVMEPVYAGARRTLTADDIAGIQALYGPAVAAPVSAPGALALASLGLMAAFATTRRRRQG